LSNLAVTEALDFIKCIKLTESQEKIAKKVLKNAIERLEFLSGV
jgi:excinuclease UvrABC ATPase subunit